MYCTEYLLKSVIILFNNCKYLLDFEYIYMPLKVVYQHTMLSSLKHLSLCLFVHWQVCESQTIKRDFSQKTNFNQYCFIQFDKELIHASYICTFNLYLYLQRLFLLCLMLLLPLFKCYYLKKYTPCLQQTHLFTQYCL